ncbi:MAG: type II toxin-antitoxin system RelE/ParE family toxin [Planctomycetaceae bacterium]
MNRPAKFRIELTHRALDDLQKIYAHSRESWGKRVTEKYLEELEAGLLRIEQNPDVLTPESSLHPQLYFYRVKKHLFACDRRGKTIIVLIILHSSMDVPSRLSELQPMLAAEVELLHKQLQSKN